MIRRFLAWWHSPPSSTEPQPMTVLTAEQYRENLEAVATSAAAMYDAIADHYYNNFWRDSQTGDVINSPHPFPFNADQKDRYL